MIKALLLVVGGGGFWFKSARKEYDQRVRRLRLSMFGLERTKSAEGKG